MLNFNNSISHKDLLDKLSYDENTGLFFWKKIGKGISKKIIERSVGTLMPKGYLRMKIQQRGYPVHRIAWFYVNGEWPSDEIDHINGIKTDNRIVNLRVANRSENQSNIKKRINNTVGLKGICFNKQNGKYQAAIKKDGKNIYLGLFESPELAHAAYCLASEKYHGVFGNTD